MIRWGKDIQVIIELEAENESLKKEVQRLQEVGHRFIDERDSARKELKDIRECQQKTEAALSEQKAERDLIAKVELLESANTKANKELTDSRTENKQLTAKLREQTESDILLNALKAVGIIKEDKPEKPDYLAENIRLQEQLSGIGPIGQQGQSPLSALFGGAL